MRGRDALIRALLSMALAGAAARGACAAAASCESLRSFSLSGGEVSGAAMASDAQAGPYCRVTLRLRPSADSSIRSELWLPPPQRWNGKFQGVGNGGLAGDIPRDALAAGLRRGYATAATDTGHDNAAGVGRFALGHPEKIVDYGHRAIHVTALAGQAITTAYYARQPRHRYFVGCSQGGQEAMMEAQRYPADYDGIIAGDPDYHQTHHEVGAHLWVVNALYGDGGAVLGEREARLVGAAVDRACDALDGVADGVLEDPRRCDFDPAVLQCRGTDHDECLSAAQVRVVRRLWAGPDELAGAGYYPGLERGGEAGLWGGWIVARSPEENTHGALGLPFFRYFVYDDAHWDFRDFDFGHAPPQIDARLADAIDAVDPDLRPFAQRGGRLIHYHGYSDPDIPPRASIDYHDRVVALAGARGEATRVDGYYRLFMVPGMGHCGGGPGPNRFDMLAALERWVEQGAAPERIVATKFRDDDAQRGVLRTRPLCPYPRVARYRGRGSTDEARSFECRLPPRDAVEH
ncbi:MAG TPA: tannase/feruloyl esterase family alpha/beta hydrolase [Steroidobacteraceae bacterium]|nr:tannase/feruloyl esterase family alpha/beta hydrolase [Steroidobacteraceae bacterium]